MQNRIRCITPLASRYCLLPAAALAAAGLLLMLVWANTGNRRTTTPPSTAYQAQHHGQGDSNHAPPTQHTPPGPTGQAAAVNARPISDERINTLVGQLKSDDAEARAQAVEALAGQSPYRVVPRLQPWVDEQLAGDALGDGPTAQVLGLYRSWGVVEPALLDRALASDATRAQAVAALGDGWGQTPGRYAKLTIAADDPSPDVRRAVLRVCTIADTAQAAGIAQLTRGHPMDDELTALYDATMQQLARHGPPISAASRRQRIAAMSYDELLAEPREEDVLIALLLHPDLPRETFEPTLKEAADLAGRGPVDQLIQVISSATAPQMHSKPALGLALAHWPTAELAPHRELLQQMASDELAPADQYAAAAATRVILKDDNPSTLTMAREAVGDTQLLASIALIPEPEIRDRLRPIVVPLLMAPSSVPTDTDALAARIRALPHIPSAADTLFETLARIARENEDTAVRFAALAALDDIPPADWPAEHDDLKLTRIDIRAVPNQMQYDPKTLTVTAGRPVIIQLINPDTMEHNLVIAAPGKLADVGLDAALLGDAGGPDGSFVPDSPNVLHHTAMVQPGQTAKLQFIAPDTPGDYPFVCTYPGHWMTMNGTMHVAAP